MISLEQPFSDFIQELARQTGAKPNFVEAALAGQAGRVEYIQLSGLAMGDEVVGNVAYGVVDRNDAFGPEDRNGLVEAVSFNGFDPTLISHVLELLPEQRPVSVVKGLVGGRELLGICVHPATNGNGSGNNKELYSLALLGL